MPDLTSLTEYSNALQQRQVSSTEIVQQALDRIRETNNQWHMFATTLDESALQAAVLSDHRRLNNKTLGPLDGVPIAIKDNLHIAGCPTFAGTAHDFSTEYQDDASVVTALKSAGAVIVGKCCMDEGALGATTNNPHTGQCYNPAYPGCTPGGSSGGSAAAVAANIVPVSIGSDTMGSIRIPAAYCNLWGLKPTYNRVNTTGIVALSHTLDTIGPLANNAEDIATMMQAITAQWQPHDFADNTSGIDSAPDLRVLRLVIPDFRELIDCEACISADFSNLLDQLANAGCQITTLKLADWNSTTDRREGLLICEKEAAETMKALTDKHPDRFSKNFKGLIDYGFGVTAERIQRSYQRITSLRNTLHGLLQHHDAILTPTTPQRAFPVDAKVPVNQADFCVLANYSGDPSLAFPVAVSSSSKPLSVQLTGPALSELRLLNIARLINTLQ